MLIGIIVGFVLLLVSAGVWGYLQGVRRNKPFESGVDSERVDPAFNPRERSKFSAVQVSTTSYSTPAPPSGRETVPYAEARESVLPATVPTRKPHGRPTATQDWNDTSVQPFLVQSSSFSSSSDDSSSSYGSGSSSYDSGSSYSGGGGDSGGGGSDSSW